MANIKRIGKRTRYGPEIPTGPSLDLLPSGAQREVPIMGKRKKLDLGDARLIWADLIARYPALEKHELWQVVRCLPTYAAGSSEPITGDQMKVDVLGSSSSVAVYPDGSIRNPEWRLADIQDLEREHPELVQFHAHPATAINLKQEAFTFAKDLWTKHPWLLARDVADLLINSRHLKCKHHTIRRYIASAHPDPANKRITRVSDRQQQIYLQELSKIVKNPPKVT